MLLPGVTTKAASHLDSRTNAACRLGEQWIAFFSTRGFPALGTRAFCWARPYSYGDGCGRIGDGGHRGADSRWPSRDGRPRLLRMRSTEAAVAADPVPRILFDDPSVRHLQLKVLDAGSASVKRQSLTIDVRNDPEQNVAAATARAAHPTLTFYTSKGGVIVPGFGGRWANQQDPKGVLASGVLDLLPNGKAETVDIAIWSNDGSIYAVNSELINRDPSEWPFLNMELHPTFEEVFVHIQIRGVGFRPAEQWIVIKRHSFRAERCDPPSWEPELRARSGQ